MKKTILVLAISTITIISSTYAMILDILHFDIYIFIVSYGCLFLVVSFIEMIRISVRKTNTRVRNQRISSLYKNKTY
jgi:hypothetical protein